MSDDYDRHPACPCGCGELADECGSWVRRLFPAEPQQDSRRFDMRAGDVR